jgi:imidazole glycerol phosphate synthase glutamine amidotransferase subunit
LFQGVVRRFPQDARCPHMGWNSLTARKPARLLAGLGENPYVYFAHSYYCPVGEATAATCTYGFDYTALLENANTFGVQFHPEKSGPVGLRIMKNFLEL